MYQLNLWSLINMDITAFNFIGLTIENATNDFLVNGLTGLITAIKPLLLTAISLYIMMQSYLSIAGKSDDLPFDVFKHCLVVICITALTLNIDNYTTYVIGGIEALGAGLASAISNTSQDNSIYQTLDQLLQRGIEQVSFALDKASIWRGSSWPWAISAFVILVAIFALTLTSAIIIIGTKFILTLLFVLGALFITFACFPLTRRYFDSWVAKVFENCLVQVFGVMIISLAIEIITIFIKSNDITVSPDGNPVGIAVQIAVVVMILLFVIRQIPNLAGSLAGGFASSSMSIKDLNPLKDLQRRQQQPQPNNSDGGRKGRNTWEQQQANKITSGNSNQSKDLVSQVVRDQIEKHNRNNK